MYNVTAPPFPEYIDDDYFHLSSIRVSAFAGMQITNGPYGAVSEAGPSMGETHAVADKALDPGMFQAAVAWVIEHNAEIMQKLFAALVDQYWEKRELVIESLINGYANEVVPEIRQPGDLARLCGLVAIHIGGIGASGEMRFGIELGCNWENEHGAGVRFEGLTVVDSGDGSVAFSFPEREA